MSVSREQLPQEKRPVGKGRTDWKKTALRVCGDWSEQLSSKGKIYYYNCQTEVSQWQRPKEWSLPDTNTEQLKESYMERRKRQDLNNKSNHSKRPNQDGYRSLPTTNCVTKHTEHHVTSTYHSSNNNQKRPRLDDPNMSQEHSRVLVNHHSGSPGRSVPSRSFQSQSASSTHNKPLSTSQDHRKSIETNHFRGMTLVSPCHMNIPFHSTSRPPPSTPWHHNISLSSMCQDVTNNTCNNDDMDISPGSSPLSGKSGSASREHSPYLPPSNGSLCHTDLFSRQNSNASGTMACTEDDLSKVVNSLLETLASSIGAPDCLLPNNGGKPDLLHSFRSVLLNYSQASRSEKVSANRLYQVGSAQAPPKSAVSTSSTTAAERLYQQLGEVLESAQALSFSTSVRLNGEKCPSSMEDSSKSMTGCHSESRASYMTSPQLQQLLSRLKVCLPSTFSTNAVKQSATKSPSPQTLIESLVSGLTQVARAMNNSSTIPSSPSHTSAQPMGNGSNAHRSGALPSNTPATVESQQLHSTKSLTNTAPTLSASTSSHCVTTTSITNTHDVPPTSASNVTGFSQSIPASLPPVASASFNVKETPSADDVIRWQNILSSASILQYVDPSIAAKYCDAAADRLVKEALLEQQRFDKLQSVLYGELSCESKTLRALVRIPETQANIHQLKHDFFQNLTDFISQRKPAVSFYDST